MSRRRKVYKKEERVDSRYGSPAVARLISTVMKRGKKSLAERIVYTAIDKSREGSDSVDPLEVLNKALEKRSAAPGSEIASRRWRDLSGADGSDAGASGLARDALDRAIRGQPSRYADGGSARAGNQRRRRRSGQRDQETRRHAQNGASEPRLCAFPLVIIMATATMEKKAARRRIRIRRIASSRSSGRATSASPRTSTPARRRSPSAFCFTPA